jgi:hypothetical protein
MTTERPAKAILFRVEISGLRSGLSRDTSFFGEPSLLMTTLLLTGMTQLWTLKHIPRGNNTSE